MAKIAKCLLLASLIASLTTPSFASPSKNESLPRYQSLKSLESPACDFRRLLDDIEATDKSGKCLVVRLPEPKIPTCPSEESEIQNCFGAPAAETNISECFYILAKSNLTHSMAKLQPLLVQAGKGLYRLASQAADHRFAAQGVKSNDDNPLRMSGMSNDGAGATSSTQMPKMKKVSAKTISMVPVTPDSKPESEFARIVLPTAPVAKMDDYWNYYQDCDRWHVGFSKYDANQKWAQPILRMIESTESNSVSWESRQVPAVVMPASKSEKTIYLPRTLCELVCGTHPVSALVSHQCGVLADWMNSSKAWSEIQFLATESASSTNSDEKLKNETLF